MFYLIINLSISREIFGIDWRKSELSYSASSHMFYLRNLTTKSTSNVKKMKNQSKFWMFTSTQKRQATERRIDSIKRCLWKHYWPHMNIFSFCGRLLYVDTSMSSTHHYKNRWPIINSYQPPQNTLAWSTPVEQSLSSSHYSSSSESTHSRNLHGLIRILHLRVCFPALHFSPLTFWQQ